MKLSENHFKKFNLEEGFDLDQDILEEKYLNFQQIFHPDKLIAKSESEKIELEHNSILINEAFEILKNPLKRTIYLLKLKDIDLNHDACHVKPDHETLINNLELREQIFIIDNQEKLKNIKKICENEIKLIIKIAKKYYEEENFEECAKELIKAKYLDKSILEIKIKIKNL
jgi:molecular chaperone HscB